MEYNIGIVNSSSFGKNFPELLERLEKIGKIDFIKVPGDMRGKELAERMAKYNILISSVTPFFDKEFFEYKKDLLLISRHGIGYNNIDVEAAKECNTLVTIVPPLVERDAVAEGAVAILMNIIRKVSESQKAAEENRWSERAKFVGNGITGKTVGVIGCGNIGSRVAEVLKHGFNTTVYAYDPNKNIEWAEKNGIIYTDLETLLKESDIISLNASLNDTSLHMISSEQYKLMKKGVYIVNNARADLLEEKSTCEALETGVIKGLAMDVMHTEPADNSHPFFKYDNCIITPHISAYTYECLRGMGEKCVDDVERFISNKEPICAVTK